VAESAWPIRRSFVDGSGDIGRHAAMIIDRLNAEMRRTDSEVRAKQEIGGDVGAAHPRKCATASPEFKN
jgi:hypothetical protein